MNLYERIKASVTPKDAAERYGLTVNRNSMAHCPFHPDKHSDLAGVHGLLLHSLHQGAKDADYGGQGR